MGVHTLPGSVYAADLLLCTPAGRAGWISRGAAFRGQQRLPLTTVDVRELSQKSSSSRGRPRRQQHPQAKMLVPGFGEKSPEAKAAASLHNYFTFVAVKIVLSQLQAYNPEGYKELMDFTEKMTLKDGDQFVLTLLRESPSHKALALRVLEVRSAYAHEDFEWENLRKVSHKVMDEANTRLMRDYLVETMRMD